MRSLCKILIVVSLCMSEMACCQYVQPMGYKDYSFWDQVNIGNQGAKLTHPSAYLELGKPSGSKRGFLLPRGNKDSVPSPAEGLQFYDVLTHKPWYFDGTNWLDFTSGSSSANNYTTALGYSANVFTLSRSGLPDLTVTLPFSSKLNVTDTTGKWVTTVYARNDSVFYRKGGIETFVFTDAAAGGAWVPVARELTIDGITHDLDSNQSWGPFLNPADTVWLHNTLVSIQTTNDNTTFNLPLYKTTGAVNIHYETPIFNANRIQSYYVDATTPHNGYFMGFDTTAGVIRWMRPDSIVGSMPTHGIDDVLAIGQNLTASRYINTTGSYKLHIGNAFPSATSGFQVDLTSNGSDATGDVYYRTSNGPMGRLPIGTPGQVFTVGGSGLPIWQDPTGGGGPTPTLAEVLAAGYTLLNQSDIFISPTLDNPNANLNIVIGDTTYSGAYNNLYSSIDGSYNYVQDASSNLWSEVDQTTERWEAIVANPDSMQRHLKVTDAGIWLIDGTQGIGKVWTSDASGLGHWETPSGGGSGGVTPPLDSVLTAGNTTTHSILMNGATISHIGSSNISFGKHSFNALTTGIRNIAIGDSALAGITTGHRNVAIGYQSQEAGSDGYGNVSVGAWALESVTSGYLNTVIGTNAGDFITTGYNNTVVGDNAAYRATTASNNIFIGGNAGSSIVTGTFNTIIGALTGTTDTNYSHHIAIGDGQYTRLLIDSVGAWRYYTYGAGTHTGTATYGAAFDANGNLIETALGSGSTPTINSILAASGSGNYLTSSYFVDYGAHNNVLYEQDHYRTEYFMEEYFRFTTSTDHGLLMYDAGFMPVMRNSTFNITQNVSDPGYILNGTHTITMINPTTVTGSASGSGQIVYVYARPSSFWTISGATVQQPDGTAITSFVGGAMFILMWSDADTAWIKMN